MVGAAVADAQAERGDLGRADINAGGAVAPLGRHALLGEKIDDGLFNGRDQFAHLDLQAMQIQQQVDHDLAGAVVGDLAATVDLDQRNADIAQDVLRFAGLAQGVDRGVLDNPEFVRGLGGAVGGERLHGFEGRRVVDLPQAFDEQIHVRARP